jgi:signal transduction histidine kinase
MTMGELASSIAHEVNQPLAGITTNGNAALRWLARVPPDIEEVRACLQRIIRDGQRAGDVIARMRTFVRKAAPQKVRLALHDVIAEVVALADGELRRHGVALHTDLAADLPPVLADRVQVQQVLLNLVMNGIEAMKEVTDRPRQLLIRSRPEGSSQVLVAVQDSGIGLDEQSLERVFEAFYTTKPEGMGMGLSISRSVIEAHGGRLWTVANSDYGATFQFTLPTEGGSQPV